MMGLNSSGRHGPTCKIAKLQLAIAKLRLYKIVDRGCLNDFDAHLSQPHSTIGLVLLYRIVVLVAKFDIFGMVENLRTQMN